MSGVKKHHEINTAARLMADWRSMAITHAIYERGPISYTGIADMLEFSPTILSQKLTQLAALGIILRHKEDGSKSVDYSAAPIAKQIVQAYHILERVNGKLRSTAHDG